MLTDYNFHLNAAHVGTSDPRFTWDADFGGDLDLVDYGSGRINFLANYESIMGDERRTFDLNQERYTLDLFGTLRSPTNEVGLVFHHVSRHLIDRAKAFPIDWNMMGVEYRQLLNRGRLRLIGTARELVSLARSFVDYRSQTDLALGARYPLTSRFSAIGGGAFTLLTVDRAVFSRGSQRGGRGEVGLRIVGPRGVVDLFLAVERRIDADPLEHAGKTWGLLGFRLRSR